MELHEKRFGKRYDHDEKARKKEARSVKIISKKAQGLHGLKGKLYAQERYKEKV
jgi:ribosome biogenesis protein NSA2